MTAKVIDGGELYHLRTPADFNGSWNFRHKFRPRASLSFGLFDKVLATADVFIPTAANALATCDDLVWVYAEVFDALVPAQAEVWKSVVQARPPAKSLIYHGGPGLPAVTTPDVLAALPHVPTLPFDGLAIYLRDPGMTLNVSSELMTTRPISYDEIMRILAPIAGRDLGNLKRNYALVFGASPPPGANQPDVRLGSSPNWDVVLHNWANLARACRNSGLRGIFFDNERYGGTFGFTPAGMGGSQEPYQSAAAQRGFQIMEAMLEEFGDIEIIHLYGPYVSDPIALVAVGLDAGIAQYNDLLGPFFDGMLDAIPAEVPAPAPVPAPVPVPEIIPQIQADMLAAMVAVGTQLKRLNDNVEGALKRLGTP